MTFASLTKTLFGGRQLNGEFTFNTKLSKVVGFGDLGTFFAQDLPEWTGCLSIFFGDEKGLKISSAGHVTMPEFLGSPLHVQEAPRA